MVKCVNIKNSTTASNFRLFNNEFLCNIKFTTFPRLKLFPTYIVHECFNVCFKKKIQNASHNSITI